MYFARARTTWEACGSAHSSAGCNSQIVVNVYSHIVYTVNSSAGSTYVLHVYSHIATHSSAGCKTNAHISRRADVNAESAS